MRTYLFSILAITFLVVSCGKDTKKPPVKKVEMTFKKEGDLLLFGVSGDTIKQLEIEIADNEYERQTGLMYRKSMREDRGMLFIFENEQPRSFYMKNTDISLDIIFISTDNKIVSIAENTRPQDESSVSSEGAAQYVLEINAGMAKKWGLQAGNSMSFSKD